MRIVFFAELPLFIIYIFSQALASQAFDIFIVGV